MKEQFALYDRLKSFTLMLFLAVFAIASGFILGAAVAFWKQ